jgi:hypothetical protein
MWRCGTAPFSTFPQVSGLQVSQEGSRKPCRLDKAFLEGKPGQVSTPPEPGLVADAVEMRADGPHADQQVACDLQVRPLSASLYTIVAKCLGDESDALSLTTWQFTVATVVTLGVSAARWGAGAESPPFAVPLRFWLAAALVGIAGFGVSSALEGGLESASACQRFPKRGQPRVRRCASGCRRRTLPIWVVTSSRTSGSPGTGGSSRESTPPL